MIIAGTTLAQLVGQTSTRGAVSIGDINVVLVGDAPTVTENKIEPGQKIPVDLRVKNTGTEPAYVRVDFHLTSQGADSVPLDVEPGSDWTLSADGRYYYNKILGPGEESSSFCREMTVNSSPEAQWDGKNVDFLARGQAVQADNFDQHVLRQNGKITGWTDQFGKYSLEFDRVDTPTDPITVS